MTDLPRFHLAFPVDDLSAARTFYGEVLGCEEGRSSDRWIDFNFRGHQIVAHLVTEDGAKRSNAVDGHNVPVPHFGLIMEWDDWEALKTRLIDYGVKFILEPYIRFEGQVGEQGTMFVQDPSGNALEFKTFREEKMIFANM